MGQGGEVSHARNRAALSVVCSCISRPGQVKTAFFESSVPRVSTIHCTMPTRLKDPAAEKRLLHAALLFGASMLGVGVSLACVSRTAKGSIANEWAVGFAVAFLLAVFVAAVNLVRVRLFYHCPRCRAPYRRCPTCKPAVRFFTCVQDATLSETSGGKCKRGRQINTMSRLK